jgi:outer membrane protein assembly factor BamA
VTFSPHSGAETRRRILRLVFVIAAALLSLAFPAAAQAKLVLGQLVLHGIAKTRDDAILARMRLRPGDPIDDAVLKAAEERLVACDLFVSVRVWLDMPREQAVRKMYLEEKSEPVDVHVTADEKVSWVVFPMGSLGGGDKAAGLVYGDQNQDGRGRQVLAAGQYGEAKSFLLAGFRVPIVASAPLTYAFDATLRLETFRFYDNHRLVMHVPTRVMGGEAQVGWVVTPTVRAMVGAMYNRIGVFSQHGDDPTAAAPAYNPLEGNLVVLQLYVLYDDTAAPEGLRHGTRISLKNEVSDGFWKSDFDYVKLDFQLELYGHLGPTYPSMVFRSVLNYPTSERGVPITQLLRAGGPDLRGYIVNEFHGDTLVVVQLEEQVPIFKGIKVPLTSIKLNVAAAAFVDTGALLERHPGGIAGATARAPVAKLADFHTGLGAGFRLLIPGVAIPAVKVDFAYGIDVADYAVTISVAGGGI